MQIKPVASVAGLAAACLICVANAHAVVIPIASTSTGLFSSSAPTLTFYWPGKDSKAVLLPAETAMWSPGLAKPSLRAIAHAFSTMSGTSLITASV